MFNLRRVPLACALILVLTSTVAIAPRFLDAATDLYTRLEVLSRMFEIIEMHYVDDVDADEMFKFAVDGLLEELDPHSRYYTAEEYRELTERYRGDYFGIGIQFDIFEDVLTVIDVLPGGPSQALGLRPGDQIVRIDHENAIGLDSEAVFEKLRGPKDTQVDVTVRRPALDEPLEFTITRDQVAVPAISVATMLKADTGYIWLNTFSQKSANQLEQHLQEFERRGMSNFILDLRGNRGGLMNQAIRITDKFLGAGKKILYTKGRTPNANGESLSTDRDTHPRYPLIVLVDHGSASASEIVAGALQDWDRALVAGQTSFGKGLVQNQFPFRDGSALFLTIARYYTPSGRLIQREYEGTDNEDYFNPDWDAVDEEGFDESSDDADKTAEVQKLAERPVFHTSSGRKVYGGGGIAPDIQIDATAVSRLAVWLYSRRLCFQFAVDYATRHAAELPGTLEEYLAEFKITDALMAEFDAFLAKPSVRARLDDADVPIDDAKIVEAARDDLRMYLRVEVASNLWGLEAGRIVLLQYDEQVQQALRLLPQATNLLDGTTEKKAAA